MSDYIIRYAKKITFTSAILILLLLLGFITPLSVSQDAWIKVADMQPPPRRAGQMAYDSTRMEIVLFGGLGYEGKTTGYLEDMWTWNGKKWTQRFPSNLPTPRAYGGMAYDPERTEMVLFGALPVFTENRRETWVWDGETWVQRFPVNIPRARYKTEMVYDPIRKEIVLFGGEALDGDFNALNDTWIWDGRNWVKRSPEKKPPGRYNHAMAFDKTRGVVVMFGGEDRSKELNDTWEWDGTDWIKRRSATHMLFRFAHGMAYSGIRGRVILFGGQIIEDYTYKNIFLGGDTWEWDGENGDWILLDDSPTIRRVFHMMSEAQSGKIIAYGGDGPFDVEEDINRFYSDTLEFSDGPTPANYGPPPFVHDLVFERAKGTPKKTSIQWNSYGGSGTLEVVNGKKRTGRSQRIRSGSISLNGEELIKFENLKKRIRTFSKSINLIEGKNILEVKLKGKSGKTVRLEFVPTK